MPKIHTCEDGCIVFLCPACQDTHRISIGGAAWTYDGNAESPSITPSIKATAHTGTCHIFVTAGHVQVCHDSTWHPGETLQMIDWPEGESYEKVAIRQLRKLGRL